MFLEREVVHTKRALASPRIVWRKRFLSEHSRSSQRDIPLRSQRDLVIDGELAAALGIVKPQTLFPQKRAVQRRLDLVQAEVLGCRPNLAPQHHSLVVPHRALHQNRVVFDLICRYPAEEPPPPDKDLYQSMLLRNTG